MYRILSKRTLGHKIREYVIEAPEVVRAGKLGNLSYCVCKRGGSGPHLTQLEERELESPQHKGMAKFTVVI